MPADRARAHEEERAEAALQVVELRRREVLVDEALEAGRVDAARHELLKDLDRLLRVEREAARVHAVDEVVDLRGARG